VVDYDLGHRDSWEKMLKIFPVVSIKRCSVEQRRENLGMLSLFAVYTMTRYPRVRGRHFLHVKLQSFMHRLILLGSHDDKPSAAPGA
jgi:hypothetical protein